MWVCIGICVGVFVLWYCVFRGWEVVGEVFIINVKDECLKGICYVLVICEFFWWFRVVVCECRFEYLILFRVICRLDLV